MNKKNVLTTIGGGLGFAIGSVTKDASYILIGTVAGTGLGYTVGNALEEPEAKINDRIIDSFYGPESKEKYSPEQTIEEMIDAIDEGELENDPSQGISQEAAVREVLERYDKREPEEEYQIKSEEIISDLKDVRQKLQE